MAEGTQETLKTEEIDFTKIEDISKAAGEALNLAMENELVEGLVEHIMEQQDEFHKELDENDIDKILRGHIFEKVAIVTLPERDPEYAALEEFILMTLKNPHFWRMDWENARFLSKEEKDLLYEYANSAPTKSEADKRMRQNDAIALQIKKDEETGETVAVITGVVEAKNYKLKSSGEAHEHASGQVKNAPTQLVETVNKYKKYFPLIVKGLDLEHVLPSRIDVVPLEQLKYTITQPKDLEGQTEIPEEFKNCEFIYSPITRDEVFKAAKILKQKVLDDLPEENKKKIKLKSKY